MLSLNKFLGDGIPFSEYLKSRRKEKKNKTKRKKSKKSKRLKSKRTKRRKRPNRPKRHKSKKKQRLKVPPSGVIIRKNDQLFKSDGQNLKAIE
jgi:hypothetical protein